MDYDGIRDDAEVDDLQQSTIDVVLHPLLQRPVQLAAAYESRVQFGIDQGHLVQDCSSGRFISRLLRHVRKFSQSKNSRGRGERKVLLVFLSFLGSLFHEYAGRSQAESR